MPGSLVPVLKWGGLAMAIIFAIALIYVQLLEARVRFFLAHFIQPIEPE